MSKTKNGGLDQYGAEPFEQQQFGTAGIEGVKAVADILMAESIYQCWMSADSVWSDYCFSWRNTELDSIVSKISSHYWDQLQSCRVLACLIQCTSMLWQVVAVLTVTMYDKKLVRR